MIVARIERTKKCPNHPLSERAEALYSDLIGQLAEMVSSYPAPVFCVVCGRDEGVQSISHIRLVDGSEVVCLTEVLEICEGEYVSLSEAMGEGLDV